MYHPSANEITSIRAKYSSYTTMDKSQVAHRVRLECTRYYTRRLLPYTRRRKAAPAPIAGQPPPPVVQQQPVDELMDIMAFTGSVENVLSAYLNRNRGVDYQLGLVPLVAPVSPSLNGIMPVLMRGYSLYGR